MTQCLLRTVYLFSIEDAWLTSGVGFNAANVVNIRGAQGGHETVKRHLRKKRRNDWKQRENGVFKRSYLQREIFPKKSFYQERRVQIVF